MQKWRSWEAASEAEWGLALEREAVIRPLAERQRLSTPAVEEAVRELRLSRSVLYDLVRRYRRRPQTSSLLPLKRGRGTYARMLAPEREELLHACIREFYLTRERPSIGALAREVRRRFSEQNLPTPNYRTVQRRVNSLDQRLVVGKREGSKRAREKFGPVGVSTLSTDVPMNVLQIDHTLVDVIVVDRERRLPIGRPWLTLAIDIASRAVVGFSVSLEAPSALSVALVLTHAVLSKVGWLADRELQNLEWPMSGLPRVIHVDNGKEFHSEALVRGCQEYGINLDHRPPAQPHYGGHIERLIGTMMGAVHLLPGATFSNPQEKGSYDSESNAVLTVPELERWLALEIAGVYHLSRHSVLGKGPLAAWQDGIARRKQELRYPPNAEEFFQDFLPGVTRLVQRDGVHFHKIRYWDNVLSPWAGRLKEPLWIKYDPRNLSRVYVRDPNGKHWPVPYADLRQPPIALWELIEARKRLKLMGNTGQTELALFANILQQRRLVKKAVNQSLQRRRNERIPEPANVQPTDTGSGNTVRTRDELKPFPVEIWDQE
jgi:putative transposase